MPAFAGLCEVGTHVLYATEARVEPAVPAYSHAVIAFSMNMSLGCVLPDRLDFCATLLGYLLYWIAFGIHLEDFVAVKASPWRNSLCTAAQHLSLFEFLTMFCPVPGTLGEFLLSPLFRSIHLAVILSGPGAVAALTPLRVATVLAVVELGDEFNLAAVLALVRHYTGHGGYQG